MYYLLSSGDTVFPDGKECLIQLKELESIQADALRVCVGLPRGASNTGALAESREISPGILRT